MFTALINKANKEQEDKIEEERKEKERQNAEDMVAKMHEDSGESSESQKEETDKENTEEKSSDATAMDEDDEQTKDIVTRSKTGSLTPRTYNVDDLRKRNSTTLNDSLLEKDDSRMTRLKSSQLANGTYLFKLGMENTFKSYVNQFTTNVIALNKPQRNEERDKKRHLSHKFSLTTASEFKWVGALNGNKLLLTNTLRQTIIQLEQSLPSPFMHPNWQLLRKPWLTIVTGCQKPKDFARALVVLQACIKPVVFATVWHEQLGHIKLGRITATEREERKKIEKREKKEREEEEERNRMIITGYVKYTMSFKHQLWKQKGEEYRIHGRWGWLWMRTPRNFKHVNCNELGLNGKPSKMMVQVKGENGNKVLALEPCMYEYLVKSVRNNDVKEEEREEENVPDVIKNLEIVSVVKEFEEIDVMKALNAPGRLMYPKIAKKSKLDDLLARRVHLKVLEERRIAQKTDDRKEDEESTEVDVEDEANDGFDRQLTNMLTGKITIQNNTTPQTPQTAANKEMLNNIAKKIHSLRTAYTNVSKLAKDFHCYSRGCNSGAATCIEITCYSPLCLQRIRVRRELLTQLRRANVAANTSNLKLPNLQQAKRVSILEQTLKAPQSGQLPLGKEDEKQSDENICKGLVDALNAAPIAAEDLKGIYVPKKVEEVKKEEEVKEDVEMKEEVKKEEQQ